MKVSKLISIIGKKAVKGKDTKAEATELLGKIEGVVNTYSGKSVKEIKKIVKDTEIVTPRGRMPIGILDEESLAHLVAQAHKCLVAEVVGSRTDLSDLEAEMVRAIALNAEFLAAVIALATLSDGKGSSDLF